MSILTKAAKAAQALRGVHRDLPEGVYWWMLSNAKEEPCKKCGAILPVMTAASKGEHDSSYRHQVLLVAMTEEEADVDMEMPIRYEGRLPKHKGISQADPAKAFGKYGKQRKQELAPKEADAEGYSDINEHLGAPPPMEEQIKRLQGS